MQALPGIAVGQERRAVAGRGKAGQSGGAWGRCRVSWGFQRLHWIPVITVAFWIFYPSLLARVPP